VRPIAYLRPADAADALHAHAGHTDVAYLAGGTTLVDLMKLDVMTPATVVDITAIGGREPALTRIEPLSDGRLRIGALVSNSALAHHPIVRDRYPVLSQALLAGATVQIRNMATVGGNLLQRTRCYYFRDTATPCNKREPGSGCSAIGGYNRPNAILGGSDQCVATHPSDMCVAMVALDAVVHVRGARGERTVPITEFHTLPGDHPERESVLEPGDLVTYVDLPPLAFARRSRYLKLRDRTSYAFALVSVAAALDVDGGAIRDARIALGGVGTRPWRAPDAEKALIGQPAGDAAYRAAAEAAVAGAKPLAFNGFKVELSRRAIVRTLRSVGATA
jgi:xanthine dehydrogenase YagS FAD-binding subunit